MNNDYKKYEAGKIIFPIYERNFPELGSRYYYSHDENCWKRKKEGKENEAVIMCAGDLMCEPRMSRALTCRGKYYFEQAFKQVRPVFQSSDFAIANLETTVTPNVPYAHEVHQLEGRYHCNSPVEYLDGLRYAGFDAFAQANNHDADAGVDGIFETVENVESKDFMHTGLFTSENERRFLLVDINNIKVGILSYTEHINRDLDKRILNELGQETLVNRYSPEKLRKDVSAAKEAGAEFIIAYIHFRCKEYTHEVIEHQIERAKQMAEEGVDCIMGSHSHSLQRYDRISTSDGRTVPVVYSLGNFMTSDNTSMITRKSIIYVMKLVKEDGKVKIAKEGYIPCRIIESAGGMAYDIWPTTPEWTDGRKRTLLADAQAEISNVMGSKINIYYK